MKFPVRMSSLAYAPGYIFFVQDAACSHDRLTKPASSSRVMRFRIVDGIPVTGPGRASFSVSAAGVLAYWPYPVGMPAVLRWFERDGRTSPRRDTRRAVRGLCAVARMVTAGVFARPRNGGADIWLRDLSRGSEHQLTFDGAAFTPQWSPDGTRIVFSGPGQSPPPKLFIRTVAGTSAASRFGGRPDAKLCVELERRRTVDRQRPHRSGHSQ